VVAAVGFVTVPERALAVLRWVGRLDAGAGMAKLGRNVVGLSRAKSARTGVASCTRSVWKMRFSLIGAACAGALACLLPAATASAQLVFGTTTTSTSNPAVIYLDVTTGETTTLWNSAARKKANGLAADLDGMRLYANDAARLNYWDFGDIGTAPTLIGGMYRTDGTTTSATGFDGLTWANGTLYGATSYPSSVFGRGIYEIPTTPNGDGILIATPVWTDPDDTGVLELNGVEFNPVDGLFYGVQSTDNTADGGTLTRGLYSIDAFGTGAFTKVADFPDGRTGIDGLAIGDGMFWLTEQVGADQLVRIFPYDPTTGTWGDTIEFALPDGVNRASSAVWAPGAIPEPASLGLLGAAGTLLLSRRRHHGRRA